MQRGEHAPLAENEARELSAKSPPSQRRVWVDCQERLAACRLYKGNPVISVRHDSRVGIPYRHKKSAT